MGVVYLGMRGEREREGFVYLERRGGKGNGRRIEEVVPLGQKEGEGALGGMRA